MCPYRLPRSAAMARTSSRRPSRAAARPGGAASACVPGCGEGRRASGSGAARLRPPGGGTVREAHPRGCLPAPRCRACLSAATPRPAAASARPRRRGGGTPRTMRPRSSRAPCCRASAHRGGPSRQSRRRPRPRLRSRGRLPPPQRAHRPGLRVRDRPQGSSLRPAPGLLSALRAVPCGRYSSMETSPAALAVKATV